MKQTTVTILTHSFLDGYTQNISRPFGGGLERYILSLCRVIAAMGLQPIVYQLSYFGSFDSEYESIPVHGWTYDTERIGAAFESMAAAAEGLIIYASCIWQPIRYRPGSIGICHGISWDRQAMPHQAKLELASVINNAVSQLDVVVSVDSQFLTYCRSVCEFIDSRRIPLLPNSVDTAWFTPPADKDEAGGQMLRILYPRRLSFERGIVPMMLLADSILRDYPNVIIEFAGELVENTPVAAAFRLWRDAHLHQARIEQRVYDFDDVRSAYVNADIAVIPTIYSEGTSLACLEAMSCGLPVVASNVGGLNDIVIDGLNGRKTSPSSASLEAAVRSLLDNKEERLRMGRMARQTALSFDHGKWEAAWTAIIAEQLADH
ncbi:glycosyltransferase family 4 protein [Paenibacillus sp. YIM B09110]|uniref:glycosyltransferase family 4 protein n=1 Tax=Paenibacillus sp. YIM B09110 TaxID=3126102 RepID=UPI00301CF299